MFLCGFGGNFSQVVKEMVNCSMNCFILQYLNVMDYMSWISIKNVRNLGMMFVSGFFGNLLVLIVFLNFSKEQRWIIFYCLVVGLIIIDLIGIILIFFVVIMVYVERRWIGGEYLCFYFGFMMIMVGFFIMIIVCVMFIERIVCIWYFYVYYIWLLKKYVIIILVLCWVVFGVIVLLFFLGFGEIVWKYFGIWCYFDYYFKEFIYVVFNYFISILVMSIIIVMILCNLIVIYMIFKS